MCILLLYMSCTGGLSGNGYIYILKCHSNQLAVKGVIRRVIWQLGGGIDTGRDGNV